MLRSAGGGGYGDPLKRPVERVAEDVALGYVSAKAAQRLYGVVLTANGRPDPQATTQRRAAIRAGRFHLRAVPADDCYRAGSVSRRRICRLNPADAARAGLGDDDLVELDTRRAAPLRAWVTIDPAVEPGTLPIDARGLAILRARLQSWWVICGTRRLLGRDRLALHLQRMADGTRNGHVIRASGFEHRRRRHGRRAKLRLMGVTEAVL